MSGKRGNSEGSITHRPDGRWEARLSLAGGKRKSFYAKTRQEASRLLAAAIRDRDRGLPLVGDRQTVGAYLASWLETVQPPILRPRTHLRYTQQVRTHLIPALGHVPLSRLTAQQVQSLYARKLAEGLSTNTVHLMHGVLHRALEAALRLGLVQRNVADLVDVPPMRRSEMQPLTPAQVRILLDAARGTRLEALYVLAVTTGMREGELLALHWRDVDLDRATLQVRATLYKLPGQGYVFAEPKTGRSRRQIALPALAVEALRGHRARQLQDRLALGPAWSEQNLVFCNVLGRPIDRVELLRRQFYPLLDRAGLSRIRFHDLRHTAATLLLSRGVNPKVVSELLGHSQVGITLDTYSHVLPMMQEAAAAAMDAAPSQ